MHVVIMGCGRVGSTLARSLEDRNHTVSHHRQQPRCLPAARARRSTGTKVTGLRLRPGRARPAAGIERPPAPSPRSAAATTPTSSRRGWRARAFGIEQRRGADLRPRPGRGLPAAAASPTVATVRWTADQVHAPAAARPAPEPELARPVGHRSAIDQVADAPSRWVGQRSRDVPGAVEQPRRLRSTRLGEGHAARPGGRCCRTGDVLHLVMARRRRPSGDLRRPSRTAGA